MDRTYCCEEQNSEALAGTAVHVDVWLLLEYPYPWKAKALEDNLLPGTVTDAIARLSLEFKEKNLKLRTQFIKQTSSDLQSHRLFFADGRDDNWRMSMTRLDQYTDFPDISAEQYLRGSLTGFEPVEEEIYLVCTNGQRDLCCARFGRPLYSELHAAFGDRIWQTTHLGGHRFAPNLLCLPSGFVYGYVSPDSGVNLVADHDQGELDTSRLRGRSHYPASVQAGEVILRRQNQLTSRAAVACQIIEQQDEAALVGYTGQITGEIKLQLLSEPGIPSSCEPQPKATITHIPFV